ncbi:MAG: glycosyltransferase family 4 protein [Thioalkalivibrio sp.]|nr:glycosyltransferase family 4 protein [Thioalkalivibrio sp.]
MSSCSAAARTRNCSKPGRPDFFVFPSRHEGLGSILLDAMRLQVPIVASAVGGIPDLVTDGKDGVLVPPGDAAALQKAILDLHAHPRKRQELAASATVTVARYSPASMADAYARLYAEAGVPAPPDYAPRSGSAT